MFLKSATTAQLFDYKWLFGRCWCAAYKYQGQFVTRNHGNLLLLTKKVPDELLGDFTDVIVIPIPFHR